jgi:hypothetical protein
MIWLLVNPCRPPPPSPFSKFLSLKFLVSPAELTGGGGGGERVGDGAKSYDGEKSWSSINHSILSTIWVMSEITLLRCDNMHVTFVSVLATL